MYASGLDAADEATSTARRSQQLELLKRCFPPSSLVTTTDQLASSSSLPASLSQFDMALGNAATAAAATPLLGMSDAQRQALLAFMDLRTLAHIQLNAQAQREQQEQLNRLIQSSQFPWPPPTLPLSMWPMPMLPSSATAAAAAATLSLPPLALSASSASLNAAHELALASMLPKSAGMPSIDAFQHLVAATTAVSSDVDRSEARSATSSCSSTQPCNSNGTGATVGSLSSPSFSTNHSDVLVPSSEKEGWCRNKKYIETVQKGFKCKLCSKTYGRYNSVSYHVTVYHRNPPIRCEEQGCQFTTREARYIHFHKFYRHQIPLPDSIDLASRKCPFLSCNHVSKSPAMLSKHIARHATTDCTDDGGRTFRCPNCPFLTDESLKMVDHLRSHQLSDELDAVGATPTLTAAVAGGAHNRRSSLQQQPNKYACDKCAYKTRTLAKIEEHQRFKHSPSSTITISPLASMPLRLPSLPPPPPAASLPPSLPSVTSLPSRGSSPNNAIDEIAEDLRHYTTVVAASSAPLASTDDTNETTLHHHHRFTSDAATAASLPMMLMDSATAGRNALLASLFAATNNQKRE